MDAGGMEKDCSALGGLFQTIMTDMKGGYPVWEDFISKTTKLQSHLRTTVVIAGAFLDAFQKVADLAMNTRGATKEIGSALTRMCMRHRSIESRLKQLTVALTDSLINPLELRIEEWKKIANQLDKDHAKEYKKARQEIKKKSSDTLKLQKKVKKGKEDARLQLDSVLQDVNEKYVVLEETEKQAVYRALLEERSHFCTFVTLLRPVLGEEIGMLGEVTHLQTILEDLTSLTADPQTLPPSSEQVILDLKVTDDYNYTYHTPPSSPSGTLSRRGTISSSSQYLPTVGRHPGIPSFEPPSPRVETLPLPPPPVSLTDGSQEWVTVPPTDRALRTTQYARLGDHGAQTPAGPCVYTQGPDRPRAMTATIAYRPTLGGISAREHLALTLSQGPTSDAQRSSRDSLHCSSGYSTQTTSPSCSEDTIPSHAMKKERSLMVPEYDYVSLHGDPELSDQISFDKSSTIPRNSDISQNYRRMFQDKRPASTVSLFTDSEAAMKPHVATIRRKPSSKPTLPRGAGPGLPIPIRTPVVPVSAAAPCPGPAGPLVTRSGSEEYIQAQEPDVCGGPPGSGSGLAGPAAAEAGVSPTDGSDVLTLIRRGVKLRKTFTNDRSAPKIM